VQDREFLVGRWALERLNTLPWAGTGGMEYKGDKEMDA
jgi:hypothetical protein